MWHDRMFFGHTVVLVSAYVVRTDLLWGVDPLSKVLGEGGIVCRRPFNSPRPTSLSYVRKPHPFVLLTNYPPYQPPSLPTTLLTNHSPYQPPSLPTTLLTNHPPYQPPSLPTSLLTNHPPYQPPSLPNIKTVQFSAEIFRLSIAKNCFKNYCELKNRNSKIKN